MISLALFVMLPYYLFSGLVSVMSLVFDWL